MMKSRYVDIDEAYEYADLTCWYQDSIDNTVPPIWTDEHLEELLNDFYVIPKDAHTIDYEPRTICGETDCEGCVIKYAYDIEACKRHAKQIWIITENGCVITCPKCGHRLELCYPDGTEVRYLPHCPWCGKKMCI